MENMNNNFNVPTINVDEMITKVSFMIEKAFENNIKLSNLPSLMLWGAPGVGKSNGVFELAENLENKLGKKVYVKDIRLLLFNPIDLRGIPSISKDKTKAIWLKPEIFEFNDSKDVINILFLDEITTASQQVQASAYQITLDHKIGEYELPENTYVICAGNRKEDRSVSNNMPKALANRLLHFNIEPDFYQWKKWAIKNGINDFIIGFLNYKTNYFHYGLDKINDYAYATPRSWERVSLILNSISNDMSKVKELIEGIIGVGITEEFISFINLCEELPNIDLIFNGKYNEIPEKVDILYILITAIITETKKYIIEKKDLKNAIKYIKTLPLDFAFLYYQSLIELIKKYDINLLNNNDVEDLGNILNENLD